MKNILSFLLLLIIFSLIFEVNAQKISTNIINLTETQNQISVDFALSEYEVVDTSFSELYGNNTQFSYISVSNDRFGKTWDDGYPCLPQLTVNLSVPNGASNFNLTCSNISVDAGIYFPENPGGGGGDEAYIRYFAESGENTKLQIGNDNDADDDISFYQLGAERLTIYNGNVGIGTTAPDGKLEIASGNTKVKFGGSGNDGIHHLSCNRDFVFNTVVDTSLNNPAFSFRTLSDFNDMSSYTPLMTITSMGNVGIGTITIPPGYKLAVDGKIICEKIKVIADVPGADYVFDKKYKLLPLNELENYIDTCKHLPDVPSADEMNRNGIDLTEMNILLLKKIEELTLYLIKQDKRINELEKSIIK